MAKFGFDVTEVEVSERGEFEIMPKGEYSLKATEAELKDTSKGDGQYLAVTFEVVKPSHYNGRKVWQNFNVNNPSDKAEKIGREQIAGWARAAGKPNARDSDELIERVFQCKLDIEKGTGGFSDRNKISSFLTGESKPSAPVSKSKFDDEPEQKPAKKPEQEEKASKETAPTKSEKVESAPTSSKKNPWD